ncbi:helix-turn-helix transcriptional regulator [Aestuariivita boseongensis]|uniref:helix-turn-helix transcriptional regulator n=1 Tax=Aestuariivita boseongensis TaxID=1470562 RepID=UPI0006835140|nr:LuxR family transcriptional regulator [Aestuariivita boseongensis]
MTDHTEKRPVGDITADMITATTIEAVWQIFCDALASRHFDRLLYCGTRFPNTRFLGNLEEALILHHGPKEYADIYIDEQLYLHSPSCAWAEKNSGFISWPEAARQMAVQITPEVIRIAQLNAQFGVSAGYVGSMNGVVPGINGVIGLAVETGMDQQTADAIWAEEGKNIETLCKTMHLRVSSLPQPILLRPLTTRQREVLGWYGQGKTTQDIADIMGLSLATVEKHMRGARESLDATTTVHAVTKAASLNLLSA